MKPASLFSARTDWDLAPNAIASRLASLRQEGAEIFDLTESNPTCCGFAYPDQKILAALPQRENLSYQPAWAGLLQAREAVAASYYQAGLTVDPQRIILTASTSEAYTVLFRMLADPQDEILFPKPSYPLFEFLVQLCDARMKTYPLACGQRWHIDFPKLSSRITARTKALVCVNPNNPTGNVLSREELDEINVLCRKQNLPVICDEVFFDYVPASAGGVSCATNDKVLTFTLGGLSKSLGLPQMKIAWIIVSGPEDQVAESIQRLSVIMDTYLSVNAPCQNALGAWLPLKNEIQEQIRTRVGNNRKHLQELFSATKAQVLPAEAGWYAVLKLPPDLDEETWCLTLLTEDHVYVHPGYFFDFDDEPYIVVSLLPPEGVFQEAVQRVARRIQAVKR